MMNTFDSSMTFEEWAHVYLDEYAALSCKPSALEHYADNLLKHVVPEIGALPMTDITTAHIQAMLRDQEQHGNLRDNGRLSAKSLRNMRTAASACFSQAVESGVISANPVIGTVVRKAAKPKVDGVPEEGQPRTRLVFNSVKTDSSERDLVVSPANQAFLESQRQRFEDFFGQPAGPDDFIVFSSSGGLTDPDNLSHYFSDLLDGLGLPHVKLHALRHTFASRAIEMGVDIDSVSGILGHSNVTTTAYYYLRPRQRSMNDALWRISGTSSAVPAALPCVVRGRQLMPHTHTRRKSFPAPRR